MHKYECEQHLCAILHVLGFPVSAVNSIMKGAARIKQHANFIFYLIHGSVTTA
jgi:hypothetical protein